MIQRFCISHTKPLLPESWYDDCICLGDFNSDSAFHVKQLDQFWHEARPFAYGAAGTHALPIAIERLSGNAELIEISSYRKRLLPSPPRGPQSQSYPTLRELSLADLRDGDELALIKPKANLEFLVAQPLYFKKSIGGQYAAAHRRKDILDYASIAIELGVLDATSASEFLASKHFVPGGVELGIYPKMWLYHTLSRIERVSRKFLDLYRHRVENYNTYQIRAVGFLSERLGSFLLIRHLMESYSNNIPADIFGYMTVVVEDNSSYSHGLAENSKHWWSWRRPNDERVT